MQNKKENRMKLNRHQIAGRIVEDPDVNYLPGSGIPALKLRVMTDDGWYDTKKKEYQKRNTYHTVKWINKDADKGGLRKDDWVFVEGQKLTDKWEDRDGNTKYSDYLRATIVVEIPDPWANRDSGGRGGESSQRGDRQSDRGDDRRGQGRDSGSGRDRGGRDSGRSSQTGIGYGGDRVDQRGQNSDRDDGQRGPYQDDDIPF
jgi:single-stranded DNA-binding protein